MEIQSIQNKLLPWLILHLAPQFSTRCWQQFLARGYTPQQICTLNFAQLQALHLPQETIAAILHPNQAQLESIFSWALQDSHFLLTLDDPLYPPLLASIADPPPVFYAKGNLALLTQPQIAIVGSRHPTHSGIETAYQFAFDLAKEGLIITSGLAHGIDSAAHRGALAANGYTISVFGCGLEVIYPSSQRELTQQITAQGLLISEFPPKTPPKPYQFPRRNRIISGLSLGTVVIEAARNSGSLITARLAADQGREVFAIPGSRLNPLAAGCHDLIQQGAKLTTKIADILEELQLPTQQNKSSSPAATVSTLLTEEEFKLLECIGFDITHSEQLVVRTGFTPQKISTLLCKLTFAGYIKEEINGYSKVTQPYNNKTNPG